MNLPCFAISRPGSPGSTKFKILNSLRFRLMIILMITVCQAGCGIWQPKDGSGSLEILHAGVKLGEENWYPRFTFCCGRGGIATGGTIRLQLPAELVDTSKLVDALKNGFLTVSTDQENVVLDATDYLVDGAWWIDVSVSNARLKTGSLIIINFDRRIPPTKMREY